METQRHFTGQAGIWLIFRGLFFRATRISGKRVIYGWALSKENGSKKITGAFKSSDTD